jgi:hypothetical protein
MRSQLAAALLLPGLLTAAEIPAGSHVLLRMMNSLSTRTASEGDQVYLRTATPISVGGQVVAPEGCYVQGVVSHARRSGRVSGVAELGIRIETIQLPGGKVLNFTPHVSSVDAEGTDQKVVGKESTIRQGTDHGKDAARIAITAGSGAGLGAIIGRSTEYGTGKSAGIGAGAGVVAGFASVLLSRGREVDLRQGSTLDVVFDRAISLE